MIRVNGEVFERQVWLQRLNHPCNREEFLLGSQVNSISPLLGTAPDPDTVSRSFLFFLEKDATELVVGGVRVNGK